MNDSWESLLPSPGPAVKANPNTGRIIPYFPNCSEDKLRDCMRKQFVSLWYYINVQNSYCVHQLILGCFMINPLESSMGVLKIFKMPCDSGELLASNSHLIQQRLQI
jgi:hypothetical protein